jgi:hypothetical protein
MVKRYSTRDRGRVWLSITLILLVAAFLRFHDLGDIPKGLEHDEVATWHMVDGVLRGERPIYFEEGYGHEPLFNYLTAIPMSLFGHNWLGERFWAPWLGMFAVAMTYALMRRMFDPLVGLSAAGLQATVLWALFFNRLGLRLNLLPFLLAATAYCFWRGAEASCRLQVERCKCQPAGSDGGLSVRPLARLRSAIRDARGGWFAVAGVFMGVCFYTYMSSRVVPLIFGAFSLYLIGWDLWNSGRGWRGALTRWWPILVCFVIAGLVMAPLALYLVNRPATMAVPQREAQVDRPLRELTKGDLEPVLKNAWALIKMWNVKGELYWQLNYADRPVFVEPISGVLFWCGLLLALWRCREPRMALLLIWIGLGMVPSLVTAEAPSWPRTMLASPAALALPGVAVSTVLHWLEGRQRQPEVVSKSANGQMGKWANGQMARVVLVGLLALSFLLTTVLTYRDYLVAWPRHPRVRYAFQSSLTEAFRYLDAAHDGGAGDGAPVVMAGLSPHDMDPWTEQCTLRRRDLSIRWIDTRSALVLPPGDAARLIALDITPVDPLLSAWAGLDPQSLIAQGEDVPRGGTEHDADAPIYYDPAYRVYRLDVAALRQRIQGARMAVYAGNDPFAPSPLDAPPQFGGLVRLEGYTWLTSPAPGAPARLLTFWRTLDKGPSSTVYGEPALKIFVHLLDRDQAFVVGDDKLGVAPDTWLAGDVIVQLHTFSFPGEPGDYAVELGWYVPPDGPRLPLDNVEASLSGGQRVLLEPVEIGK